MKKVIDYDPLTGITETYHSKPEGGFFIETKQDVAQCLRELKRSRNENAQNSSKYDFRSTFHHEASIPMVVVMKWRKELGDDPLAKRNQKWLMAKLNDPNYRYLRARNSRL